MCIPAVIGGRGATDSVGESWPLPELADNLVPMSHPREY